MAHVVEKRKERRIRVSIPIKVVYQGKTEISGMTENISRLGAYLEAQHFLPVGAQLDVVLSIPRYTRSLPSAQEVHCTGSVFRSHVVADAGPQKVFGTGIFFTGFTQEADRQQLSQYIDFLIVQEEREIKRGLKRWRKKRDLSLRMRQAQAKDAGKAVKESVADTLKLILAKLEEIQSLLKTRQPPL